MARRKSISLDTDKLQDALSLMPDGKQVIGEKLLVEIRFLAGTLEQLRQTATAGGANSPALKTYNATIQRYALLYKQFSDLLPHAVSENHDNALLDFIKQG